MLENNTIVTTCGYTIISSRNYNVWISTSKVKESTAINNSIENSAFIYCQYGMSSTVTFRVIYSKENGTFQL